MSDLVRNTEDRFSHVAAQIYFILNYIKHNTSVEELELPPLYNAYDKENVSKKKCKNKMAQLELKKSFGFIHFVSFNVYGRGSLCYDLH